MKQPYFDIDISITRDIINQNIDINRHSLMNIELDVLRSFVVAAQEGSFSAAARQLGRAQSVISTHIAYAEAELGYLLFQRDHKPKLTEKGQKLLPYAQQVIKEYEKFSNKAIELWKPSPLHLHIGLDHALETSIIMDTMAKLARQYPELKVQIENLNAYDVNWFFKHTEMSLAVVFSDASRFENESYEITRIPVSVIVGNSHPLSQLSNVTVNDLKRYRQLVVTARDSESPSPIVLSHDSWEVNSGSWALSLVAKNLGWAALPKRQLTLHPNLAKKVVRLSVQGLVWPEERLMLLVNSDRADIKLIQWWKEALQKLSPLFEKDF